MSLAVIAGCGRLGFDAQSSGDASVVSETDADAELDASNVAGLVLLIPMDDDPTTGTIDTSDPSLVVTCTACPVSTVGQRGNAYRFGGVFSLNRPSLVGSAPYTVVMWMRPAMGDVIPLAKPFSTTSTQNVFSVFIAGAGAINYETTTGMAPEYAFSTTQSIGAWHHVALSWDGTMKRIYVDGALEQSMLATIADSNEPVVVGYDLDVGLPFRPYAGDLDELAFYDRALSDTEVMLLSTL